MLFTPEEHDRIAAAIAAAETRTSGEIFAIVTDEVPRNGAVALGAAALVALVVPPLAVAAGLDPVSLLPFGGGGWHVGDDRFELLRGISSFAALQDLLFLAVLALAWFTRLNLWLTPKKLRRERVHAEALKQFLSKGLHVTAERTGVLLYVSMADHVAEVIADEGIYARVAPEVWGDTILALIEGIKAGRAADGFVQAIGIAGAVLAEHFPPRAHNPNELPDKLIEL
jgi:putative membrane protein